jgi:hypothetical protein
MCLLASQALQFAIQMAWRSRIRMFSHYCASSNQDKRAKRSSNRHRPPKTMPSSTMKVALTTVLLIFAISQVAQGQDQASNNKKQWRQNRVQAPVAVHAEHSDASLVSFPVQNTVQVHTYESEESADAGLNDGYSRGSTGQAGVDTAGTIMDPRSRADYYGKDSVESRKLRGMGMGMGMGMGKRGGKSGNGKGKGKSRSSFTINGTSDVTSKSTSKRTSKSKSKSTSTSKSKGGGKQSKSRGE